MGLARPSSSRFFLGLGGVGSIVIGVLLTASTMSRLVRRMRGGRSGSEAFSNLGDGGIGMEAGLTVGRREGALIFGRGGNLGIGTGIMIDRVWSDGRAFSDPGLLAG